ncbi:MAG: GspMb/PilO family protein [Minisyncoccia bacterium]
MSRLIPLILIVAAVSIFFFYIDPAYTGSIQAAQTAIASDNQALAAAAAYTAKENQLAAARDQIPPGDLARLAQLLPPSVNNVETILDLNALAARSGLTLTAVDVSSDSSGNSTAAVGTVDQSLGFVDLSISATGTYQAFRTFLAGIESSERLLDVQALSVKGSTTGVYSYSMTLRLYWLK